MKDPRRISIVPLFLIGLGLAGLGGASYLLLEPGAGAGLQDAGAIPAAVDFAAPDLRLIALDGGLDSLAAYRGKVVLINLWATWCPPCREEMPALQTFHESHAREGFVLIGINQEEPRDTVQRFVEEFGLTFRIWLDPQYAAQRAFMTSNLPSSYVIDRGGRVRLAWVGRISLDGLERYVVDLIQER